MEDTKSIENVAAMRPHQDTEAAIGRILQSAGKLSADDVRSVLRYQLERGGRFGEAALKLNLVNESDISLALSRQFRYPCLPSSETQYAAELVAAYRPASAEAEALRAMRSHLNLRWFKGAQKMLAVVSVNAGDGASLLISNLAISFSQLGKRTLIVDANLRQPDQHRIFNLENRAGLSDIIVGRAGLETIAKLEAFGGLAVLPAGTPTPNPSELISDSTFRTLLNDLAARFDIVLCDSPAFMGVSDAVSISSVAGGIMLVIKKNKTSLKDVQSVSNQLVGTDIQLVGSALLDF